MKKKIASVISISVLIIVIVVSMTAKRSGLANPASQTAYAFDTIITIQIYEGGDAQRVLEGCQQKCEYYESILSRTIEGSDIWKINHAGGQPVVVSEDTARLIRESVKFCQLSDGALDITMAPVIELWDFSGLDALDDNNTSQACSSAERQIPSEEKIRERLSYVNYKEICISTSKSDTANKEETTICIPAGMGIDLGAVAKGYIADRLAEYMIDNGVTSAIINLGGNTLTIGQKPVRTFFSTQYVPFKVGIQEPFKAPGEVAMAVELGDTGNIDSYTGKVDRDTTKADTTKTDIDTGKANTDITTYKGILIDSLVTSGDYQRYFEKDGRIYHHILSTKDGMPVWNGLDSVSIHCGSSLEADALSTAVFCLGQDEGQRLLDSLPEAAGYFIESK